MRAPPQPEGNSPLLAMRRIDKAFFGIPILKQVDFTVQAGEVHALMGENGAGKSTLMKILAGIQHADAGDIVLKGHTLHRSGPRGRLRAGIALIHQELNLVPHLSVAENIFLGAEPSRGAGIVDRVAMERDAAKLLERLEAGISPRQRVSALSLAGQQLVEIARALRHESCIVVMDEPTAALSDRESRRLLALIGQLRDRGTAIIYISHRLPEIGEIADRVTVLRDGEVAGVLERGQIKADRIIQLMVGRELGERSPQKRGEPGLEQVRIEGLGDGRRLHDISFHVRSGEIVGLAGLVGAGRTEAARMIFGADRRRSGRIVLDGNEVDPRSPRHAIREGIAYVPEDRKAQGLFLQLSVQSNIVINLVDRLAIAGMTRAAHMRESARRAVAALGIRAPNLRTKAGLLSGGNQQKLLIGRWLGFQPRLMIFDEPTRGVDIGAKRDIYRWIDGLASEGIAILVISSELPEIIALCDRVYVMREGRIAGELNSETEPIAPEAVMRLATGEEDSA